MSIYEEMNVVAKELLGEFKQGQTYLVKLTPGTGPSYAPGKPLETRISLDAAVRGAKFKYVTNNLAVASDLQVTFAGSTDYEPAPVDFVELDGVRYKIVYIDRKPSVGVAVAFTLIVRK